MASVIGDYNLSWFRAEEVSDEPDVAVLVETFSGLLYRVVFSVLRNRAEAEDVVQETFLRVLQKRGELAGVREFRPWLVRIAWNLALDRKRQVQPEQIDDLVAAGLVSVARAADVALVETGYVAAVMAAVERLPRAERDVLLLSAVEELTTAEIAVVVGRSESSVRSLVFRARAHLQERLGKGGWR